MIELSKLSDDSLIEKEEVFEEEKHLHFSPSSKPKRHISYLAMQELSLFSFSNIIQSENVTDPYMMHIWPDSD